MIATVARSVVVPVWSCNTTSSLFRHTAWTGGQNTNSNIYRSSPRLCALRHMTSSSTVSCVLLIPLFLPWTDHWYLSYPGGLVHCGTHHILVPPTCPPCVLLRLLAYSGPPGYMRRRLLNKDIFHFWEFPEYLWMQMNKEQLG